MCSAVDFNQILTRLDLRNNQIDDQGAQHLGHVLQENTVRVNSSTKYHAKYFLVFVQTLTVLDLGTNRIGDLGAQHLANGLLENNVRLYPLTRFDILEFSYVDTYLVGSAC